MPPTKTHWQHPLIAHEGWPFLAIAAAAALGDKVSASRDVLAQL